MRILGFLFLLSLWPLALQAQVQSDSVKHRNDCRLATQIIETGHPAPHAEWALDYIGACGTQVQGAALATALRRLRSEPDTGKISPFWQNARFLRDGALYEAAVEIAADRSASVPARVFALLGLLHRTQQGRSAGYGDLIGGFYEEHGLRWVRGGCARTVVIDDLRIDGSPLPADYRERINTLARRLRSDTTEPLDVQTAAACL
jgi:hypothetical protein